MKSQQSDLRHQTSCKKCVFAIYEDKTQTGCVANRVAGFGDKAIAAYDEEKEFYVIDRFCNLYRGSKWNGGVADINKARDESSIKFNVFFDCDDLDDIAYFNKINKLLDNIPYKSSKLSLNLVHNSLLNKEVKENMRKTMLNHFVKINITDTINKYEYYHNTLLYSKQTYHTIITKDNIDNIDILSKLDHIINEDLLEVLAYKYKNCLAISNLAYKIQAHVLNSTNYQDIVDSIVEKSKDTKVYIEHD